MGGLRGGLPVGRVVLDELAVAEGGPCADESDGVVDLAPGSWRPPTACVEGRCRVPAAGHVADVGQHPFRPLGRSSASWH